MFVFDRERKLQYQGWLDDSRFPDAATVKSHDARDAVLALLDSQPVPVAETRPFGCSTKWLEKKELVAQDDEKYEKAPVTLEEIDGAGVAALAKNPTDKFRLINVWSTTCVPCVREFPGLMRVSRRMGLRDFELITLTTDLPEDLPKAKAFLEKQRAVLPAGLADSLKKEGRTTNNYLYKESSMGVLIEALDPAWEGPQPHTVLIAPGGKVVYRHTGAVPEKELLETVLKVMTNAYQPGK